MTIEKRLAEIRERCDAATDETMPQMCPAIPIHTPCEMYEQAIADLPALVGALEEIWTLCHSRSGAPCAYTSATEIRSIIARHLGGDDDKA